MQPRVLEKQVHSSATVSRVLGLLFIHGSTSERAQMAAQAPRFGRPQTFEGAPKNHMGPVITASHLLLGQRALERSPATMVWSTSERISETDPKSFSPTSAAEVSPELSPQTPGFEALAT